MNKYLGVAIAIFAIAIAVIPSFTDCQSQGKFITLANGSTIPMKCHWTGIAEIATGAPLFVVGVMMTFSRRKSSLMTLSIMGGVLGIMAVMLPTNLIGVCSGMASTCRTEMQPALISLGAVTIAGSLGGLIMSAAQILNKATL